MYLQTKTIQDDFDGLAGLDDLLINGRDDDTVAPQKEKPKPIAPKIAPASVTKAVSAPAPEATRTNTRIQIIWLLQFICKSCDFNFATVAKKIEAITCHQELAKRMARFAPSLEIINSNSSLPVHKKKAQAELDNLLVESKRAEVLAALNGFETSPISKTAAIINTLLR